MSIKITKLPKSQVEIEGEIDAVTFESYREAVLADIARDLEVPGFRKGKVPQNMISKYVSEMSVLEEMAEHAISHEYSRIVEDNKIDAIGRPEIAITKIASGNPLGFKIVTAVVPEMKLPDYKKIAGSETREKKDITVEEKEIDESLLELRRMRAHQKLHDENIEHTTHDHREMKEDELPAIDEAFLKSLGDFKDLADLRAKIADNLKLEKTRKEQERRRIAMMEAIMKDTKVEIPEVLIEGELSNMIARMKDDISRMGLTFEQYLTHLNKKEEDIKNDLRSDAEKRAKMELVMTEIAKLEKIEPEEKDIEKEAAHLMEQYSDADPIRARMYITNLLTNEKVFQFLEDTK